jgi:hypothetical protein
MKSPGSRGATGAMACPRSVPTEYLEAEPEAISRVSLGSASVVNWPAVRRTIAILALVSLLGGPVMAWPAVGCCGDADCCKSGICPMHAKSAKAHTDAADEAMHCHHQDAQASQAEQAAPSGEPKCSAKTRCQAAGSAVHPAPLPRWILTAAEAMLPPATARAPIAAPEKAAARGFVRTPFEPPRMSA